MGVDGWVSGRQWHEEIKRYLGKERDQDVPFAGVLTDVEERREGAGRILAQRHAQDRVALDLHSSMLIKQAMVLVWFGWLGVWGTGERVVAGEDRRETARGWRCFQLTEQSERSQIDGLMCCVCCDSGGL